MARTALYSAQSVRNSGTPLGAGATPDATNGNIYANPGPFKSEIFIHNGDSSAHNVIVRASGYAGVATGAANSGATSSLTARPSRTACTCARRASSISKPCRC